MLCYVMLCYVVMLRYVMLWYVMLCYVMLCYVMLCYVMLCYVMLCYVMSTGKYRYALHNDVSVNDGPHIRRWPHNILILLYINPYPANGENMVSS